MGKPREWWIYDGTTVHDIAGNSFYAFESRHACDIRGDLIHVIEYSAYEDVCKALDQIERKLFDVDMPKEIFELKAKLAIAIEALEKLANLEFERDEKGWSFQAAAEAVLEKLK